MTNRDVPHPDLSIRLVAMRKLRANMLAKEDNVPRLFNKRLGRRTPTVRLRNARH